jgi:hypothetical protein
MDTSPPVRRCLTEIHAESRSWRWGEDAFDDRAWAEAHEPEYKYADMQLYDGDGNIILPIKRDHHEVVWDGWMPPPEAMRLIAAAPTLLTALKAIVFIVDPDGDGAVEPHFIPPLSVAKAAIALAEAE